MLQGAPLERWLFIGDAFFKNKQPHIGMVLKSVGLVKL
jgi:hypothetical protein